ncbi:MAG: hypothetical protein ACRDT4_25675 [Micromonosporaceae bacterium]
MDTGELGLFTAALGLGAPWRVTEAVFAEDIGRLDLQVDYPRGTRCMTPTTRRGGLWISFSTKAFLPARVPRVRCPEHGVRLVQVPWARPGSGFTMLFEALVLTFAKGDAEETGRGDCARARHPGVAPRRAPCAHRPGPGGLLPRAAGGDG